MRESNCVPLALPVPSRADVPPHQAKSCASTGRASGTHSAFTSKSQGNFHPTKECFMELSRREMIAAACAGLAVGAHAAVADDDAAPAVKAPAGQLTVESLGTLLESLGLKPKQTEQ